MAHGPLTRRTEDPLTRAHHPALDNKSDDRGDAPDRPSKYAMALSFEQALDEFLLAGRARSLSPKTLDWYQMIGRRFVRIQAQRGLDPALNAVTTGQARGYVVALQEAGLAPISVAGFVRGLKVIFGWCAAEGLIDNIRSAGCRTRVSRGGSSRPSPRISSAGCSAPHRLATGS